jgi:hypothetical protein
MSKKEKVRRKYMLKISADNTKALISGITGPYSKKTVHEGTEFGMNAIAEFRKYNQKLGYPLAAEDMYIGRDYKIAHISNGKKSGLFQPVSSKIEKLEPNISDLTNLDVDSMLDDISDKLDSFLENLMPANFTLKYMPVSNGKPDLMALIGAAFERLGLATSRSTKEMKAPSFIDFASLEGFTNKEGKIDLEKEAVRLLILDMASAHKKPIEEVFASGLHLNAKDVTGTINEFGQRNTDFTYYDQRNLNSTKGMIAAISEFFKISEAVEQFKKMLNI